MQTISIEIHLAEIGNDLKIVHDSWLRILCGQERYDVEDRGVQPLLPLLNYRSTIVHVGGGDDPMEWIIQYFSGDFGVYQDRSYVGMRINSIPDTDARTAVYASIQQVVRQQVPIAHRIITAMGKQDVAYEKVGLPLFRNGEVEKVVTVSRDRRELLRKMRKSHETLVAA